MWVGLRLPTGGGRGRHINTTYRSGERHVTTVLWELRQAKGNSGWKTGKDS